jgi:heme/copper-type cytochrome/quinol oxidase subunit 3
MMNRNKMAMILFIASESIFFAMLVAAYIYFHLGPRHGPGAAQVLDPFKTGIYSLCLFSSSYTVWRADLHLGSNRRKAAGWLFLTILLGAIFLVGQGLEYRDLIHRNVTISRDLFGTTFFTLTGFHGLHVTLGLVMLAILLGLTLFGRPDEPRADAMVAISYYWHFVDAVWVLIFAVVYLWAFL